MGYVDLINNLANYYGILPGYWDIWGRYHETSLESRVSILNAMGFDVETEKLALSLLEEIKDRKRFYVPSVFSFDEGEVLKISIICEKSKIPSRVEWKVEGEELAFGGVALRDDFEILDYFIPGVIEEGFCNVKVSTGKRLPWGYYKFILDFGLGKTFDVLAVVAPSKKLGLPDKKLGLSLQLYGLSSKENFGIGDFGDLRKVINWLSSIGANFVGINPLNLLFVENPYHISPYSPSSRRLLNPWYIKVEEVEEYSQIGGLEIPEDEGKLIDYTKVIPAKATALRRLYEVFKKNKTKRWEDFNNFCAQEVIKQYGLFEALREIFNKPWFDWPSKIDSFGESLEDRANFYRYLQFVADEQLTSLSKHGKSKNPSVLLYLDLPLGVDAGGFDAWYDRNVYSFKVRLGAPPDDFNPEGQEWGVVPMIPEKLKASQYKPFIETIRASMKYADILRIDHIMGLFRLFWIPEGLKPSNGAYVLYPMEDLSRIVAIESLQNNCLVVGEDLGTVPDEVRIEMAKRGFFSYKVLYFEKKADGSFKLPEEYPEEALATITTHDLPTFKGYWLEKDIDIRKSLGMISSDFEESLRKERLRDRLNLLKALEDKGLFSGKVSELSEELVLAVHRYVALSKSKLVSFQLEDILGEEDQPNLPGTTTQYPCWRKRYSRNLEDIIEDKSLEKFFVKKERVKNEK